MANSSLMDTLFQRPLEDLVKGIRLQAPDSSTLTSSFLSKATDEIRREIKSTDPHTKSTALLKLTYLHSLYGFDMSWAAFHVVEVISYPQFPLKKIGYLAAATSFNEGTEVVLLVTNQMRKDLSSSNDFEVSLALQCLSVIAATDLCRDLCNDIFTLLSSTRSYVKKKAIAVVLRVFSKYPDAVRVCFKRLVENLESSDPQAMCSAVGVFCELTWRDPKAYLPLAPEFYRILLDCKNNWVLIKVLKIFAKLAPLEPRLAKKIVDPICQIMRQTMAKSLLFECIRTVFNSLSDHESAVKLAAMKIRELLVEDDPNLKYLALQALSDIASKHLWAVLQNKEVVFKSLSDVDPNIKLASLCLVMAIVSEDNVADITKVLVNYALKSDPEFCNEILRSMLVTCSRNFYEIVVDFDWYVSLLGGMSRIPHCQTGEEIGNQLIDIGMRVKDARPELVNVGRDLLIDPALLGNPFLYRILSAAAWVSGEYVEFSKNPFELMEALLQPRTSMLPPSIRAVYIQSAFKVLVFSLQSDDCEEDEFAYSSSPHGTIPVGLDSRPVSQCTEGHDLAKEVALGNSEQVIEFNPMCSNQAFDHNGNEVALSRKETSIKESVVKLLDLTETALEPLSWINEVEVQDRARNVLGVIQLVKQEIFEVSDQHVEGFRKKEFEPSDITTLIFGLFTEDLGPIPMSAQARVPVPDCLVLEDNLKELDTIYSDIQLHPSSSFSLGTSYSTGKEALPSFTGQHEEDSESSTKSGSTLAHHRNRHGLYYLPSEKDDTGSNDYPPANESKVQDDHGDEVDSLVKLTEESLILKKKANRTKPRPVVVKLDEAESFKPTKLESKDDLLSGAIRDILLGNEEISTSSQYGAKTPTKVKGKEKLVVEGPLDLTEKSVHSENLDVRKASTRKSKHKSHGKERRKNSHSKNDERRDETSRKEKKGIHHHRTRHKAQGQDWDSNMVVKTPEIPDFLL